LRRCLALQPDSAEAHYVLGEVMKEEGKQTEAAAAFVEVDRLHRRSSEYAEAVTQYNLGLQDLDQKNLIAAREAFQKALSLRPEFAEAHTNLGGVLLDLGEVESAIAHFRTAIDLRPNDARAHYNMGLALTKKGDLEGAQKELHQAHEIDPEVETAKRPASL
jgi:tetratricopeptide (TPR) repeat protein